MFRTSYCFGMGESMDLGRPFDEIFEKNHQKYNVSQIHSESLPGASGTSCTLNNIFGQPESFRKNIKNITNDKIKN